MLDFAVPDGRSKFNSESVRQHLPRNSPSSYGREASGTLSSYTPSVSCSASCDISSSLLTISSLSPTSLTSSPSLTSSSSLHPSNTYSFMTTPLDSRPFPNPTPTSSSSSQTAGNRFSLAGNTVCLGHGLDASVDGLLVTIVLFGLTGLLLWVRCALSPCVPVTSYASYSYCLRLFGHVSVKYTGSENGLCKKGAYVHPFGCVVLISRRLRPAHLGTNLWAFLNPPVPMVPPISNVPTDPSDPAAADARRFPSDEELSQRTLWFCFLMVLGWSILGLVGALPLYLISVPCLAETARAPRYLGGYSTLQDLSVLRVLQLLDNRDVVTPNNATVLEVVNGQDLKWRARLRIIILMGLLIVLGLVPAVFKILREYSKLIAFRRTWTDVHLQGKEMGWISARTAPGFAGWGERRFKDFILRTGLSSSLDFSAEPASSGVGRRGRSGRHRQGPYMFSEEDYGPEVDISSLFTIVYVFSSKSPLSWSLI